MVAIQETGRERSDIVIEEEDHDGWGPIRPRRSSMPPEFHAADTQDDDDEPDTMRVLCTPLPQGMPEKR